MDELKRKDKTLQVERQLLTEKSNEVQVAKTFLLDQTDSLSVTDVKDMTEKINFNMQQIAAQIADQCSGFKYPSGHFASWDILPKFWSRPALVLVLMAYPALLVAGEARTTWIQIILQAVLVTFSVDKILGVQWSDNSTVKMYLSQIHDQLDRGQDASMLITRRWRVLTHAVTDVKLLINLSVIELDMSIEERLSSVDLLPQIAAPRTPFQPGTMEDANSATSPLPGDYYGKPVFASVSIGLAKSSSFDGRKCSVVLSPKVILESVLHDTEEPEIHPF